jgi:hypothetical protein
MKQKTFIVILAIAIISMFLSAAILPEKVRLTIHNRTGAPIALKLYGGSTFFYLYAEPGDTVFSVDPKIYDVSVWQCGEIQTGRSYDFRTVFWLSFPPCLAQLNRVGDHGEMNIKNIRQE